MEPLLALLCQEPPASPLQRCDALLQLHDLLTQLDALPLALLQRLETAVVHTITLLPSLPCTPAATALLQALCRCPDYEPQIRLILDILQSATSTANAKASALTCLGALCAARPGLAVNTLTTLMTMVPKLWKIAGDGSLRAGVLEAIALALKARNPNNFAEAARLLGDVVKLVSKGLQEKDSARVRVAAFHMAEAVGPLVPVPQIESLQDLCLRSCEEPVTCVRLAAAKALGKLLHVSTMQAPQVPLGKRRMSFRRRRKPAMGMVAGLGALSAHFKKASTTCLRDSLALALGEYLRLLGRKGYAATNLCLRAVMDFFPKTSTGDASHGERVISTTLSEWLIQSHSEQCWQQVIKTLITVMDSAGPMTSQCIVCLHVLRQLLRPIQEALIPHIDVLQESLLRCLLHTSATVRAEAALTLASIAVAHPQYASAMVTNLVSLLHMDHAELEMAAEQLHKDSKKVSKDRQGKLNTLMAALSGHASALAAVMVAAANANISLSAELSCMVFSCAQRISSPESADVKQAVTVCRQEACHLLVYCLASLGPDWTGPNLNGLLPLWELDLGSGRPSPPAKSPPEDPLLQNYQRIRQPALRSLACFLRGSPSLLATSATAKMVAGWLESATTQAPASTVQRTTLLQHTLKAAAYDALAAFPLRLMPERNAFLVTATQCCFVEICAVLSTGSSLLSDYLRHEQLLPDDEDKPTVLEGSYGIIEDLQRQMTVDMDISLLLRAAASLEASWEAPTVGAALVDSIVLCLSKTFPLHTATNKRLLIGKITDLLKLAKKDVLIAVPVQRTVLSILLLILRNLPSPPAVTPGVAPDANSGAATKGSSSKNTAVPNAFESMQEPLLQLLGTRELELRLGAAECLGLWARQGGETVIAAVLSFCAQHAPTADPCLKGGLAAALGALQLHLPLANRAGALPSVLSYLRLLQRPSPISLKSPLEAARLTTMNAQLSTLVLSAAFRVLRAAGAIMLDTGEICGITSTGDSEVASGNLHPNVDAMLQLLLQAVFQEYPGGEAPAPLLPAAAQVVHALFIHLPNTTWKCLAARESHLSMARYLFSCGGGTVAATALRTLTLVNGQTHPADLLAAALTGLGSPAPLCIAAYEAIAAVAQVQPELVMQKVPPSTLFALVDHELEPTAAQPLKDTIRLLATMAVQRLEDATVTSGGDAGNTPVATLNVWIKLFESLLTARARELLDDELDVEDATAGLRRKGRDDRHEDQPRSLTPPTGPSLPHAEPGDEAEGHDDDVEPEEADADEAEEQEDAGLAFITDGAGQPPRGATKLLAVQCLSAIMTTAQESGDMRHTMLNDSTATADDRWLVTHLETLVKLCCLAADAPPQHISIRAAGLVALAQLVSMFHATPDPSLPESPLLSLYSAQITSVIRQSLALSQPAAVLQAALALTATYCTAGTLADAPTVTRFLELLTEDLLQNILDGRTHIHGSAADSVGVQAVLASALGQIWVHFHDPQTTGVTDETRTEVIAVMGRLSSRVQTYLYAFVDDYVRAVGLCSKSYEPEDQRAATGPFLKGIPASGALPILAAHLPHVLLACAHCLQNGSASPSSMPDILFGVSHQLLISTLAKAPTNPRALLFCQCLQVVARTLSPAVALSALQALVPLATGEIGACRSPLFLTCVALFETQISQLATLDPELLDAAARLLLGITPDKIDAVIATGLSSLLQVLSGLPAKASSPEVGRRCLSLLLHCVTLSSSVASLSTAVVSALEVTCQEGPSDSAAIWAATARTAFSHPMTSTSVQVVLYSFTALGQIGAGEKADMMRQQLCCSLATAMSGPSAGAVLEGLIAFFERYVADGGRPGLQSAAMAVAAALMPPALMLTRTKPANCTMQCHIILLRLLLLMLLKLDNPTIMISIVVPSLVQWVNYGSQHLHDAEGRQLHTMANRALTTVSTNFSAEFRQLVATMPAELVQELRVALQGAAQNTATNANVSAAQTGAQKAAPKLSINFNAFKRK